MQYLILSILLFILMLFYFKVANRYNIIDKPNHRSAHTEVTLRGGGIIIWLSSLLYFIQNLQVNYLFFLGITIVSVVSFWDDIQSLPNKVRVLAHFSAISLAFYNLNVYSLLPIWSVPLIYVFFIGIINAYNFMDGINGITGLYTLSLLSALGYVNHKVIAFTDFDFIIYPTIASLVFLFFNFRKKARCFAGDIGSIGIAFWVVYLILKLILISQTIVWVLFLVVYGVDTICTILHRLYLKENIFEAHRHHFYQILSNDYKIDHRIVSTFYALTQLLVSLIVINFYQKINTILLFVFICLPLMLIYGFKFYLIKRKLK
jgi:UDP-N-acetylmuramyl pentapeptide phosphotransferase/UDP-N-acetylglucosamine-1-phosphate transferase